MTSLLGSVEKVAVEALTVHPRNARRGDLDAIAQSLEAHGQFAPLIAQRSTGYVLHGNHTYRAARERLSWKTVDVIYVDVSDQQAQKILLAANRTSDLAAYDDDLLVELLRDVEDLDGTGFTEEALEDLEGMVAAPMSLDDLASTYGEWEESSAASAPAFSGPAPAAPGAAAPSAPEGDAPRVEGAPLAWPSIVITVPPQTLARYERIVGALEGEPHERLSVLLDAYEAA